jgi:hypothetical protein
VAASVPGFLLDPPTRKAARAASEAMKNAARGDRGGSRGTSQWRHQCTSTPVAAETRMLGKVHGGLFIPSGCTSVR